MATHMPMAAARQPFAPLNSSRLQNLTSLKNRQNALSSPIKRKAASFDDDAENIDPVIYLSPKRSKGQDGTSKDPSTFVKPVNFFLTKAPPSPNDFSSLKPTTTTTTPTSPRRPILSARSPAPRLNTSITKTTPLSAPAGRSPTRKRIGILNRRKTANSPFTRVDPPKFSTPSSGLGFSIDAALSGTISSRARSIAPVSLKDNAHLIPTLHVAEPKDSWSFEIYEDTEEELATNLMEHSTCTLDISSDEESAERMRDERGKENVPPVDDVSQTRTALTTSASSVDVASEEMSDLKARLRARRSQRKIDAGEIDIDRSPLGDLAAEDFYAEGCSSSSVFVIASDEPGEVADEVQRGEEPAPQDENSVPVTFDFVAEVKGKGREGSEQVQVPSLNVEALMAKDDFEIAPKASLLEPLEKAEENFEIWASGSAKDEDEGEL